jgi:hypothetical protein
MSPHLTIYYPVDVRLRHIKSFRQFRFWRAVSMRVSDRVDIGIGKLSVKHFSLCLSVLGNLVGDVVLVGPKKKVRRIYAAAVVTFVQNMTAIWNCANVKFVRETMGQMWTKSSISIVAVDLSTPKNAAPICYCSNALVEAILKLPLLSTLALAVSRTEGAARRPLAGRGVVRECAGALLANANFCAVKASHDEMLPKEGRVCK